MNETIQMMLARRSIRAFEEKPVPPEVKAAILSAAMRAPTAGGLMLYSVLDVTDQRLKDLLAETCDHQPFIAKAPVVLVFLADYRRWFRKFQRAGAQPPAPRLGDLLLASNDAVIAAHTACLAAESLGLGSCYIGDILERWEDHRDAFGLPPYVAPVSMLVLGYPTEQQKNRPQVPRFPQGMIVFENRYHDLTEEELAAFSPDDKALALYQRKYISDFALEMERSSKEIFRNWAGADGLRLYSVVLDCADHRALLEFYQKLLGWPVAFEDDPFYALEEPCSGVRLCVQREEDYQPPVWPARPDEQAAMAHVDLGVHGREALRAAVEKALSLGAKLAAEQFGGEEWTTLIDPAGHPLCVVDLG